MVFLHFWLEATTNRNIPKLTVGLQVDFPITDVLQMMGRAGRPQFDSEARAVVMVHEILGYVLRDPRREIMNYPEISLRSLANIVT